MTWTEAQKKKLKELSKGMAQKVQLIASVVHRPEFVILDEPFSGLDPMNQQGLEAMIRALAADGATVLFSTHVMQHAERLFETKRGVVRFFHDADALAEVESLDGLLKFATARCHARIADLDETSVRHPLTHTGECLQEAAEIFALMLASHVENQRRTILETLSREKLLSFLRLPECWRKA